MLKLPDDMLMSEAFPSDPSVTLLLFCVFCFPHVIFICSAPPDSTFTCFLLKLLSLVHFAN